MSDFWHGANVLITGGAGFLGRHVVRELTSRGCRSLHIPRSCDFDLTDESDVSRMYDQHDLDVVIHLAAVCGGIGANQARPGKFFRDNILMGVNVIHGALLTRARKVVVVGTVCAYPKHAPVPFREEDLWLGYPEETNAPYGIAKKALLVMSQAYREEYGLNSIYLLPVNLYGPCFDADTDVMTPDGVKNIRDITTGDEVYTLNPSTHAIEVESVTHIQQNTTNEFYTFTSSSVDFRVTPDHQIYYQTNGSQFRKRRADWFSSRAGNQYGQINLAQHRPIEALRTLRETISLRKYTDIRHIWCGGYRVRDSKHSASKPYPIRFRTADFMEFLGWYITEGSVATHGRARTLGAEHIWIGQIRISQSASANPDNVRRIGSLLKRMGIRAGYDGKAFYFQSRVLSSFIRRHVGLGSAHKRIPDLVFWGDIAVEHLQILWDALMLGDGHTSGKRFTTKSDSLKNDFIHLSFLLGKITGHPFRDGGCWRIGIRKQRNSIKYRNISRENVVEEPTYCITTEKNHIIYAGRNGCFNWIGQCDNFDLETSHVIPAMIRKMVQARRAKTPLVHLWGDGTPSREFLFVEDCAQGIVDAAERYDDGDPVNLGVGREITMRNLAEMVKRATRYRGEIVWEPDKPNGQPRRCLSTTRALERFGWKATTLLDEGLRRTVVWYEGQGL